MAAEALGFADAGLAEAGLGKTEVLAGFFPWGLALPEVELTSGREVFAGLALSARFLLATGFTALVDDSLESGRFCFVITKNNRTKGDQWFPLLVTRR